MTLADGYQSAVPITAEMAGDIRAHLENRTQYGGQVPAKRGPVKPEQLIETAISSYSMEAVATAPYVLEIAMGHASVAVQFLSPKEPVLYSVNAFWSRPHDKNAKTYGIQKPHRDYDDEKFLALFIYLTDVLTDDDGPFSIETAMGWKTIYGKTGTSFFADTSRLHCGKAQKNNSRLMLWIRWGVSDPPGIYVTDEMRRLAPELAPAMFRENAEWRRATRLIFDWGKLDD